MYVNETARGAFALSVVNLVVATLACRINSHSILLLLFDGRARVTLPGTPIYVGTMICRAGSLDSFFSEARHGGSSRILQRSLVESEAVAILFLMSEDTTRPAEQVHLLA